MRRNEQSFRGLCDTTQYTNGCIMGTLGRKAREKEAERMSEESMIEHFPNLIKT